MNRHLDAVVTILKYNKITIDHAIYIKVLSGETVSYSTVSTYDVLKDPNNKTVFTELTRFFEEKLETKVQEGSVLKYLNFRIFQSSLSFSVDQTDKIMKLVNEWFPNVKLERLIHLLVQTLHMKIN